MMFESGERIGGYRVIRLLGEDGVGAVYEVEHVKLGVRYAMKVFAFDGQDTGQLRRRFEVEGKTLARFSHPNLVRVIDLDVDETHGIQYFVMDLVLTSSGDAMTLADIEPGSVDEEVLGNWFKELCSALSYVHEKGVVHRDVKLNNILVAADGHVIMSDFGISRLVDPNLKADIKAATTTMYAVNGRFIMGTAGYMAPELYSGDEATAASDVYALGVCFFKLLTNIWYDPSLAPKGVKYDVVGCFDARQLLDMFEKNWTGVLSRMLDSNPAKRQVDLLVNQRLPLTCSRRVCYDIPKSGCLDAWCVPAEKRPVNLIGVMPA